MEVRQIGNLTDNTKRDNPSRRRVYDSNGLSPTLQSCMGEGGNLQPFIVAEVKQIGNMDNDRENFENPQCGRVYDSNGLSPTINTCQGGQREPKILEIKKDFTKVHCGLCGHFIEDDCDLLGCNKYDGPTEKRIVAMRGRNPDNPSDRTACSPTEQRLEPNSQGICNTLTSVQKDNMVLENVCINDRGFTEKEPQISIGTAPTLRAETHGNLPKVFESQYRIRKLTPA